MDSELLTMPPVIDTEEERRKREAAALGTRMPPVPSVAAQPRPATPSPSAMPPVPMAPLGQPDASGWRNAVHPGEEAANVHPIMPPVQKAAPPAAPDLNPSAMPPVPPLNMQPGGPAKPASAASADAVSPAHPPLPAIPMGPGEKREAELREQGRPGSPEGPPLSGWKKVLDTIGSIFPIGRAIETAIPGSPQNFDWELARATAGGKTERGEAAERQKLQAAPAEADLRRRNIESEIGARGDKDTAALAKQGLTRDKDGNVVADENSPVYKNNQQKLQDAEKTQQSVAAYRQSQMDLNEAREETERAKNDPNSPAYKQAQQKLAMAQRAHDVAAQNLGLHQAQFENKLHEQELVKPSGQTVSRGDAAGAALKLLPGLKDSVRQNAKAFGPLVGRIAKGEIAIGNVDPEVQKFYSQLQSFYSLQPAIHGFRNAEFVKDFNTFVGNLQTNPDSLVAGLEGLEPTLKEVEKSGRTFKPRIVEGQGGGGEAGGMVWDAKAGKYVKKP